MKEKIKKLKDGMKDICWISADDENSTMTHGENLRLLIYSFVGIWTICMAGYYVVIKLVLWIIDKIYDLKEKKEAKEEEEIE